LNWILKKKKEKKGGVEVLKAPPFEGKVRENQSDRKR